MKKTTILILALGLLASSCNKKPEIEVKTTSQLIAFPNPATTIVYFRAPNPSNQPATIQVFDPTGTMILDQNFQSGVIDIAFNIVDRPKGVYQVVLVSNSSIVQTKFVKV